MRRFRFPTGTSPIHGQSASIMARCLMSSPDHVQARCWIYTPKTPILAPLDVLGPRQRQQDVATHGAELVADDAGGQRPSMASISSQDRSRRSTTNLASCGVMQRNHGRIETVAGRKHDELIQPVVVGAQDVERAAGSKSFFADVSDPALGTYAPGTVAPSHHPARPVCVVAPRLPSPAFCGTRVEPRVSRPECLAVCRRNCGSCHGRPKADHAHDHARVLPTLPALWLAGSGVRLRYGTVTQNSNPGPQPARYQQLQGVLFAARPLSVGPNLFLVPDSASRGRPTTAPLLTPVFKSRSGKHAKTRGPGFRGSLLCRLTAAHLAGTRMARVEANPGPWSPSLSP
ncbi:hypothetical protein BT67DRAFT_257736 [Trichocladium antarcticum]|uniref:Uncharacterized protein n=1 Tax=Trichocladium antarcticum TaxID=1450529 RepID=A0AAN6UMB1_9PEZI|nr:hypothetical protein BT67DRAFT_257736 [Trichocladium antarcticum]